jgi:hypothetical protein
MITKNVAKLYRLNDYVGKWIKKLSFEDRVARSVITLITNDATGEIEILQTNDAGDEIKTRLSKQDVNIFYDMLQKFLKKK